MSPRRRKGLTMSHRFPRVSGDEPDRRARLVAVEAFSPRERG